MPRYESTNRTPDAAARTKARTTALIGVVIATGLGVLTWFGLSGAADKGVARLARIDHVRSVCDSAWRAAKSEQDTARVDRRSLADTIDAGSSAELSRCGNLRPEGLPSRLPNPREMSGEPMPRGLR